MTVAIITASIMLSKFRAIDADKAIMTTIKALFMVNISFIVAPGLMCLCTRSLEMQEAPDVAKVDVQDMHAARNPTVSRARINGETLSLMNFG